MEPHTNIPDSIYALDNYLAERESSFTLKPGTEAKIVWNDESEPSKTDYAIVYLHGFRASHQEGNPVHTAIAEHFGYNLFLSRIEEHGIQSKLPLYNLTEEKIEQSARFALEIGRRIGKKIILMGTSTGGSLALYLAAQAQLKGDISSIILYSPLIKFFGFTEQLLTNALSRTVLGIIPGSKYLLTAEKMTYAEERIWNRNYTLQGALTLGSFVQHFMQEKLFARIDCPVFIGYYYKNKQEQDQVVSVKAIENLIQQLHSGEHYVKAVNFPNARTHVLSSSLLSKSVDEVITNTEEFLEKCLLKKAAS